MYSILFLLCLLPLLSHGQTTPPTICLGTTCFTGSWIYTSKGLKYASFQGIKYAKAPIGNLRFKPPQAYTYNEALVDVSSESKVQCAQINYMTKALEGVEDCLLLNIYIPDIAIPDSTSSNMRLPVMVWIHGGGLIMGSGKMKEYNPEFFMDTQSVVIVTMNYRLGPFGFLSLGNEDVPGNAGARDQTMALTWVKNNIASFGGNDQSVTIFGESAGGSSVALHLLSPMSKGLFQRAILQSAWTGGWYRLAEPSDVLDIATEFSNILGCNQSSKDNQLKCLQEKEVADILTANTSGIQSEMPWRPVRDRDFTTSPYIKSKNFDHCLETGHFNKDVDIMIGTTEDEGLLSMIQYIMKLKKWEDLRNNINTIGARPWFNTNKITSTTKEKVHKLIDYYVGSIDNINEGHQQGMVDFHTDKSFLYSSYKLVGYLVKNKINVYQYIVTYEGEHSLATAWFGLPEPIGVFHGDDLLYLWNFVNAFNVTLNKDDAGVMKSMMDKWINFAKSGNPGLPWTPVGSDPNQKFTFWNISSADPEMSYSQDVKERMELWDEVMMSGCASNLISSLYLPLFLFVLICNIFLS